MRLKRTIKALEPIDARHLLAAEGWIGLRDFAAANDELEQITAASRSHPDVLQLRWHVYANAGTLSNGMPACRRSGLATRSHGDAACSVPRA